MGLIVGKGAMRAKFRQATDRDTPPEDVSTITAGLLAQGSLQQPVFPTPKNQ